MRPGQPRARRRDRHRRPRDRARAARWPGGEVRRQRLLRGDARARAPAPKARPARLRFEWADALALPYARRHASTPRPSASAHATSPTSRAGSREMVRVVRPGGRVVVLEITTPTRAPLSLFYRLWFDRIVPRPRSAARRSPRCGRGSRGSISAAYTLPAELGAALPRAPRARGGDGRRGPAGDQLRAHGGRHHRDSRRYCVEMSVGRDRDACREAASSHGRDWPPSRP